jgi:hypothetical protein
LKKLDVEELPDIVGADGGAGEKDPARAVGQALIDLRARHFVGIGIVSADRPDAVVAGVAKIEVLNPLDVGTFARAAGFDAALAIVTIRREAFAHPKKRGGKENTDDEIRHADAPETDAGGTHRGDFVMARMICQRVKEREEKGDREDDDQKVREPNPVEFDNIPGEKMFILKLAKFGK